MISRLQRRGKVPFRKTRDEIDRIYEILNRNRLIPSDMVEYTLNGVEILRPPSGESDEQQFTPSVTPIENDEAKALSISKGWVCMEWAEGYLHDQFQIPMGHRFFLPEIAGVPLGGTPAGEDENGDPTEAVDANTLTLDANQRTNIWLEINYIERQVQIGGTQMISPDPGLGDGIYGQALKNGAEGMYTSTDGDHAHTLSTTDSGGDSISGAVTSTAGAHSHTVNSTDHVHETQTYIDQLCYHASNEDGSINFIATAEGSDPDITATIQYVLVGWYDLDDDGAVTESEWYIKGGAFTPPPHVHHNIKGRVTLLRHISQPGSDATSNPLEAST